MADTAVVAVDTKPGLVFGLCEWLDVGRPRRRLNSVGRGGRGGRSGSGLQPLVPEPDVVALVGAMPGLPSVYLDVWPSSCKWTPV